MKAPLAARRIASPAPEAARTAPLFSTIFEPALVPAFSTVMPAAVMEPREMAPLVRWVLPVPGPRWTRTWPDPALIEVPGAMLMTAAPASRSALMTPEDNRVLA